MSDEPFFSRHTACVYRHGSATIIKQGFHPSTEFYVYSGDKLVRVCPSIGMAREIAAGL